MIKLQFALQKSSGNQRKGVLKMKNLFFVAIMLLTSLNIYAADYPRDVNAIQEYLHAKLGGLVSRATISTDRIDAKISLLQYQACKDERALLRVLTRHIAVSEQLMTSKANGDGQRGLLIAYSALKCANIYLKDKVLAAGIAVGMLQPNIGLAADDFVSDNGKRFIANEILDAVTNIDDDEAIIKAYNLIIQITVSNPNTVDTYRTKYAYYLYDHAKYTEALSILNSMTDPSLIAGVSKLRMNTINKLDKEVK
jgi:hypothetical protein